MRLFTALDLTNEVVRNLECLLDRLRPAASLRWSPPHNMHVTAKFIGEWPEERLEEVKSALTGLPRPGNIDVAVRGLGWFPNARAPRVFWGGIEASEGLYQLARDADRAMSRLGVASEKRDFSPHLTLARIPPGAELAGLRAAIEALPSTEFGAFTVDRHYLYQSVMGPAGSKYTKLAEFAL
ncbi:MAG: RNA 2',3'-cyclic phosphodiesterase [Bryobacteraceae bacterium]|nr:RNA 2',3'-cyclic phosphodiesterase [Bryobacteraceae bacterium]